MISNHKIQTALDEIKDISRIDLALYTEKGKPVAATFEPEGDLEGAITSFADSMAESQMLSGYHFFKVIADGEIEYILLTKSQAEDAYMVGRLAVCQIRNLAAAYMEQFDRNNFMQNILLGNMLVVDMYNKAQKLHIEQAERVVFVIDLEDKKDSTAVELVKNLFATKMRDYVTEVDVRIITPHIPDKKHIKYMTEYNYGILLKNGIRIYEYEPGFIHSKVVMNEHCAIVGTINMDYRSFYLHYENGVWIYDEEFRQAVEADFINTFAQSIEITYEDWKNRPLKMKIIQPILHVFDALV